MPRGGARNRSGPAPDSSSERSERRGLVLTALPAEGHKGKPPKFPLPAPSEREVEVWRDAWKTPQACAWALPSEHWRHRTVAMWVRLSVRAEDPEAPAALLGQLHRFADQIGLTTAGLAEMGWAVAKDELMAARARHPEPVAGPPARRLRVG